MNERQSIFKLIVAETSAFALTFVPLALWFFEDYSNETVTLLYLMEYVMTIVLSCLCFVILAPAEERVENITVRRGEILSKFLLIAAVGIVVFSGFLLTFIFLLPRTGAPPVPFEHLKTGFTIALAFQLFEFFTNLYLLRPLSLRKGNSFLGESLTGFLLLTVSILVGGFAALVTGKNYWFFIPFVVFKTIIDLLTPIQFLRSKKPAAAEDAGPFDPRFKYKAKYRFGGKLAKR